ncbi:MAG: class I SAM-dependent methyltransferase [Vicinamibacterales bacterium]
MSRTEHWNRVYTTKGEHVSWFEAVPETSLRMLDAAGITSGSCVIDIGGGDSRLVDALLDRGLRCITVLDVSGAALERARQRLGESAAIPVWIEADVAGDWSAPAADIWHDRAVFHFLTDASDRARYLQHLRSVLKPGGSAIIATFALDGPEQCSSLPVVRYSPDTLAAVLGPEFTLADSASHTHTTPWGSTQSFQYSRFVRTSAA